MGWADEIATHCMKDSRARTTMTSLPWEQGRGKSAPSGRAVIGRTKTAGSGKRTNERRRKLSRLRRAFGSFVRLLLPSPRHFCRQLRSPRTQFESIRSHSASPLHPRCVACQFSGPSPAHCVAGSGSLCGRKPRLCNFDTTWCVALFRLACYFSLCKVLWLGLG